jgi:hypothetical protein
LIKHPYVVAKLLLQNMLATLTKMPDAGKQNPDEALLINGQMQPGFGSVGGPSPSVLDKSTARILFRLKLKKDFEKI